MTEPDDSDETMATVTFRDATRTYPKSTLPAVNRLTESFFDKYLKGVEAKIEPLPDEKVTIKK